MVLYRFLRRFQEISRPKRCRRVGRIGGGPGCHSCPGPDDILFLTVQGVFRRRVAFLRSLCYRSACA